MFPSVRPWRRQRHYADYKAAAREWKAEAFRRENKLEVRVIEYRTRENSCQDRLHSAENTLSDANRTLAKSRNDASSAHPRIECFLENEKKKKKKVKVV